MYKAVLSCQIAKRIRRGGVSTLPIYREQEQHVKGREAGDKGTGSGRVGYGRRERKGREAGVLRRREAGEKCETLCFLIQQCVTILSKTRIQNIFDLHLTSSRSLLRLLSKQKFALGLKNRLTSGELVNLFTVVTS